MDQINFLRKYFNDYRNLTLFDNKTLELIVKTKNAAWRQELVFKQSEIIQGLNKKLGKNTIKSIRFI